MKARKHSDWWKARLVRPCNAQEFLLVLLQVFDAGSMERGAQRRQHRTRSFCSGITQFTRVLYVTELVPASPICGRFHTAEEDPNSVLSSPLL